LCCAHDSEPMPSVGVGQGTGTVGSRLECSAPCQCQPPAPVLLNPVAVQAWACTGCSVCAFGAMSTHCPGCRTWACALLGGRHGGRPMLSVEVPLCVWGFVWMDPRKGTPLPLLARLASTCSPWVAVAVATPAGPAGSCPLASFAALAYSSQPCLLVSQLGCSPRPSELWCFDWAVYPRVNPW
jgi:hypothetical protein